MQTILQKRYPKTIWASKCFLEVKLLFILLVRNTMFLKC